jgi:GDP-L-fucose synthase
MLGSSIAERWLLQRPHDELLTLARSDVDLRERAATRAAIAAATPDAIIHAAAVVGGIAAKLAHPTPYLLDNLFIDSNVIGSAIELGIPELLNIGSAAIYPETYRQPFVESDVLAAPLEPANEGYAVAKIAAMKLCEYASEEFGFRYRTAIPSNLYGPNDDYSLSHGHLIAAALAKVHAAHENDDPTVLIWGDGTARREFTYSVDLASWLVDQVGSLAGWPARVNLGSGTDHSVTEYYEAAKTVVGYRGQFEYDDTKPSGMHQRILDSTVARSFGWSPSTELVDGMTVAYNTYLAAHTGAAQQ